MYPTIHPFPARMAPELAIGKLDQLPKDAVVLDPMSGSGTVVRHASELGLKSFGFDLDPLAVLISRVSSRRTSDEAVELARVKLLARVAEMNGPPELPWIDGDADAERFVNYWFGEQQQEPLRKIARALSVAEELGIPSEAADVLRLSLSRIIITKTQAASLAQDTSHSRPHRVATSSSYDVIDGFEKSVSQLRKRLRGVRPIVEADIGQGDARELSSVQNDSIDFILTSPPYLNALDYMRGHRMSLIWLGHRWSDLSKTRSVSIGSERAPDEPLSDELIHKFQSFMGELDQLPSRYRGMINRYVADLYSMAQEVSRVLRDGAHATFVMGDSCLKGVFVSNSNGLVAAAELAGLHEVSRDVRELPQKHRYLPTPQDGALAKRMRKETVLTFRK